MQHQRASCLAWVVLAVLALSSCDARIIRGLHQTAAGPIPSQQQRKLLQNPDAPALTQYGGLTMEDIVPKNGYPLEKHAVDTPDGWRLNMYRIPHGKGQQPGPRPVVLLHHGITLSSACFTLLQPNESMAYVFADAGFDVWMANTRGNTFSRGNYNYSFRDPLYWRHSIDQYALVDAPAQIDLALQVSGAEKLAVVGHSQGSSIMYALLSSKPEYNEKVSVALHMGPVAFIADITPGVVKDMASVGNDNMFQDMQMPEFLWYRLLAPYVKQCAGATAGAECMSALNNLLFGPSSLIKPEDFELILQTWPASVSTRNLHHWASMFRTAELDFSRYDYGTDCTSTTMFQDSCNQAEYGSLAPPQYELSLITTPTVILKGTVDVLATPADIAEQERRLQMAGSHVATIEYPGFSHMDFIWQRQTQQHITDMIRYAKQYAEGTY